MKEPKRRRSLSGAVLVMILTVMFVLIILLTATLTTVTTANQRIYTKFEENQAYYTARSALDVFTQNMLSDGNYIAQSGAAPRPYIHGKNIRSDKMKQGLGLQLDLYSITAQSGHNVTQKVLYDYAHGITVDDKRKDEYANYFGTKPTIGSPGTEGTDINEITYEVTFPTIANGGNAYGKLSDSSTAKVKVEVLERKYNLGTYTDGGTEKTIPDTDVDDFLAKTGSYTGVTDDMIAEAIANGNRKKDKMRIQITATTEYSGVEGIAVLILDSNEPPVNNSSKAITTFGTAGSDNLRIVGGSSATDKVTWNNQGYVYGSVYAEDDYEINTGAKINLNAGESFFVGGDLKISNQNFQVVDKSAAATPANKKPFVYVGGILESGNFGASTFSNGVDLLTHGIKITGNAFTAANNVYCVGNCDFSSASAQFNISGNLYVQGDIITSSSINTDFCYDAGNDQYRVGGVTGKIICSGRILSSDGTLDLTSGFAAASTNIVQQTLSLNSTTTGDKKIPTIDQLKDPTVGENNIKVTLPTPSGNVDKEIPNHVDNFNGYYQTDTDGDLVDSSGNKITDITTQSPVPVTAENMAQVTGFTKTDIGATDELKTVTTTNITSGTYSGFKQIDTAGGSVKCFLKTGDDYGKYYLTGGGIVEIVLDPTGQANSGTTIVVDTASKTMLKVYGPNTGTNYSLWHFYVYNNESYEANTFGTALNVGDQSGNGIVVPNIYYYFSDNTKVHFNDGDVILTGYVYAPGTEFTANAGGSKSFKLKYNGADVEGGNLEAMTIIGSLLGKSVNFANSNGISYINPNLNDDTPGDPIHQWQSFQYIRG